MKKSPYIPKSREQALAELKHLLTFCNAGVIGNLYMIDFPTEKFIAHNDYLSTVTGYSKRLIEEQGFSFLDTAFPNEGRAWHRELFEKAMALAKSHSPEILNHWEVTYALSAQTMRKTDVLLQHRFAPYWWDENGNLSLAIFHVWASSENLKAGEAQMINKQTLDSYHYANGEFKKSEQKRLNEVERRILYLLSNGADTQAIMENTKLSRSAIDGRKRSINNKLGTKGQIDAVAMAIRLGYIK